jgi:ABC-type lipoprotein export system ATPase subunit
MRWVALPAHGGLMSSLNAWENISLPVAYHAPGKLAAVLDEVRALLDDLGGVDDKLLGKLPEDMTLYERRLAAYIRALLESPELLWSRAPPRAGPTNKTGPAYRGTGAAWRNAPQFDG